MECLDQHNLMTDHLWTMNKKMTEKVETIRDVAARGCAAFEGQTELSDDPKDDDLWNGLSRICRRSLKKLSMMRAKNKDEVLSKARLLAMAVEDEGEGDQRFALAESILQDLNDLTAGVDAKTRN